MPDVQINFRLPEDEAAQLNKMADNEERTTPNLVRAIVRMYIRGSQPPDVIQTTQIRSARDLEEAIGLPAKRTPEVAKAAPAPPKAPKPTQAEVAKHPAGPKNRKPDPAVVAACDHIWHPISNVNGYQCSKCGAVKRS